MNISNYKTLVFDCDGVVLNSNKVKTDAFYRAALPFGEEAAQKLVAYHVLNGGISRYKKFEWFIQEVIPTQKAELNNLLNSYAKFVRDGLLTCDIAQGLLELRNKTSQSNWLIVSGGDQQELREVFSARKIEKYFNRGIFGSPDNKEVILEREMKNGNISEKALFIGDSKYDYQVSEKFGLDFLFLKKWSEFQSFQDFFENKKVPILDDIYSMRNL